MLMQMSSSLTNPALRLRLLAYARRRVGAADQAEDLVQEALTQAIAQPPPASVMESESGLIRWLTVMVRNKSIDQSRRERFQSDVTAEEQSADPLATLEARDALRHLESSEHHETRDEQPLRWVLREAEGEALSEIAEAEALPAPVIRQRISRFRSRLRATLLIAATFAVLALLRRHYQEKPIAADVSVGEHAPSLQGMSGTYAVASIETTSEVTRVRLQDAQVHIRADHIEISGFTPLTLNAQHERDGVYTMRVGDAKSTVTVRSEGKNLIVECWNGKIQGRLRLLRID
jgi:RNA polymerase sigma-70 factor, ECF subfamily